MDNSREDSQQFYVELGKNAHHLILKRGRLFVTGQMIPVKALPQPAIEDVGYWLVAIVKNKSLSNLWEHAHGLACRLKAETGKSTFVEPHFTELGESRYDRLKRGSESNEDEISKLISQLTTPGAFGLQADPVRAMIGKMMPNAIGFMPANTIPSSNAFGFEDSQFGSNQMPWQSGFAHSDPGLPAGAQMPHGLTLNPEPTFPPLAELAGWSDLDQSTRKMFEVEALQLRSRESANELPESLPVPRLPERAETTLLHLSESQEISHSLFRFIKSGSPKS